MHDSLSKGQCQSPSLRSGWIIRPGTTISFKRFGSLRRLLRRSESPTRCPRCCRRRCSGRHPRPGRADWARCRSSSRRSDRRSPHRRSRSARPISFARRRVRGGPPFPRLELAGVLRARLHLDVPSLLVEADAKVIAKAVIALAADERTALSKRKGSDRLGRARPAASGSRRRSCVSPFAAWLRIWCGCRAMATMRDKSIFHAKCPPRCPSTGSDRHAVRHPGEYSARLSRQDLAGAAPTKKTQSAGWVTLERSW